MDTTTRRIAQRRGVGRAQAAGISSGLTYAAEPAPSPGPPPRPAADPANLSPATTLAVRYAFWDGEFVEL